MEFAERIQEIESEIAALNGIAEKSERLRRIGGLVNALLSRLNGENVTPIIEAYVRTFQNLATVFLAETNASTGVPLLRDAIQVIVGDGKIITSLHGRFFELCIKTRDFEVGQSLIHDDARELLKEKTSGTPEYDVKSVLFYFFHAGNLLCQAEQFERALRMYMSVLVLPSTSVSPYVLEAYKKFVLINLILGSPVKELPSNMSCGLERAIRPKCSEYDELAKICRSTSYGKNVPGNVINYLNSVVKRVRYDAVMRVAEAFKVIKFEDVIRRAFLKDEKEAQELIQDLVEAKRLLAVIDKTAGFIRFEFPDNTNVNAESLGQCAQNISELKVQVGKYDDIARSHKYYVLKQGGHSTPATASNVPSTSTNDDEGFGQVAQALLPIRPPPPPGFRQ
ncbi:hypothetical protein QR680_017388 [Steinernema hermaphroditum]|uniref:COP9 signalosome complex subunit 3 n=1 Tax=Steinernema hermaphroditum TaxID=289476 RepID=A0AA39HFK1_9BILA|nr:hypothetical protein QR680_017388 [Steinernema hermaphroditum]